MGRMKLIDDISLVVVKSRFVGWSYSSEILIFIRNTVLLPAVISSPSISRYLQFIHLCKNRIFSIRSLDVFFIELLKMQ